MVCALPFAGQTLIPTDRVGSAYRTRINRHHPRARFCIIPKRNSGAAKPTHLRSAKCRVTCHLLGIGLEVSRE